MEASAETEKWERVSFRFLPEGGLHPHRGQIQVQVGEAISFYTGQATRGMCFFFPRALEPQSWKSCAQEEMLLSGDMVMVL